MMIGIDPGPLESCAVWWDGTQVHRVVNARTPKLTEILAEYAPHDSIACEWIESFGMAVGQDVFQTVFQVGSLAAFIPMRLIPRRDVKLHLCASSRAKDANVRQAIIDRVGIVGTKKRPGPLYGVANHAWPALGVAITAMDLVKTDNEATFHTSQLARLMD